MSIRTFAAIFIGSYEVSLKIFELSGKRQLRKIDHIRSRIELGLDSFGMGSIGYERVEELCLILKEFRRIMDGYHVDDYRAYTGSVLRDTSNELFILDQIRLRTQLEVQIISNSEHRLINYQALAFQPEFEDIIREGAAVVDVGGGSIQITLFWKGKAVTTQQIVLGLMRIREKISGIQAKLSHYDAQIQEMIDKELDIFRKLYLKDKEIKYVVMGGNYVWDIMHQHQGPDQRPVMEGEKFQKIMKKLQKKRTEEIARELNFSNEHDPLLLPSVVLYRRLAEAIDAKYVWTPGLTISDGIAYSYALENNILKNTHDFDADILSAAMAMAERYSSFSGHTEAVRELSVTIFDALKRIHGMGGRERLLLQVAAILHDCGRYVSLVNQADWSYQIIMASELIGLNHLERVMVACAVKYVSYPTVPYEELKDQLDQERYMVVAKLAVILRLSNALDRSHRQKFKNVRAALKLKEKQLLVTLETKENIILEKGLMEGYTDSFEQIFSIQPVIREKRILQ